MSCWHCSSILVSYICNNFETVLNFARSALKLVLLNSHKTYRIYHSESNIALLLDSLLITDYDLQVNTYKYVGVNTCYPMSVLVSRLIAD